MSVDQALQIVINSLVELEVRTKHAEAKMETLEQVAERRTTNQNEEELAPVAQEEIQKTKVARTYAQAVQEATATVIIQAKENRSAEEVENQITKSAENKEGIKNVKHIRNGVKIVCESAEQATRIKDALTENEAESGGLSVKTANLKRKGK